MPASITVHSICTRVYTLLPCAMGHLLAPTSDARGCQVFRLRQLPGAR